MPETYQENTRYFTDIEQEYAEYFTEVYPSFSQNFTENDLSPNLMKVSRVSNLPKPVLIELRLISWNIEYNFQLTHHIWATSQI